MSMFDKTRPPRPPADSTADAADGIMPTLRCANPDCGERLGQVHFFGGGGVVKVFACPKCGKGSEFRNTPVGISATQLISTKRNGAAVNGSAGAGGKS